MVFEEAFELCFRFDRATQIRKLPIKQRNKLVVILEDDAAWKKVMGGVRRDPTQALPCPIKYTNRHMKYAFLIMSCFEYQEVARLFCIHLPNFYFCP